MEPCTIVLFGASGDLTQRMVMPAIFRLVRRGLLSPECRVVGVAHEGVVLQVLGKLPGQDMRLQAIDLPYSYSDTTGDAEPASAYEHLLLDALSGDPTFFARADEVETSWGIVDSVIVEWTAERATGFPNYTAGSAGPSAADDLLARDGRRWHAPGQ